MKRFFLFVATLAAALTVGCSTADKVVYLADFMTEDSARDAVPAVRAALEECARIDADRLVLPGGELRLRPEMATMRVTMPLDIYPTSAAVATREVAESIARSRDFHAPTRAHRPAYGVSPCRGS